MDTSPSDMAGAVFRPKAEFEVHGSVQESHVRSKHFQLEAEGSPHWRNQDPAYIATSNDANEATCNTAKDQLDRIVNEGTSLTTFRNCCCSAHAAAAAFPISVLFAWPSLVGCVQHRQLATRAQTRRSYVRHLRAVPTSSTLHMLRPAHQFGSVHALAAIGPHTHTRTRTQSASQHRCVSTCMLE